MRRDGDLSHIISLIFFWTGAHASQTSIEELESFAEKLMMKHQVPGLAIGVVDKNGPIFLKGYGVRSVENNLPVSENTQFAIGSTTKAFTATAIGILKQENLIEWDLPIKSYYLTDFQLMDQVATNLVTPRDLLTHRTGLPRHDFAWLGTPFSMEELYNNLRYLPPTASIREKVQYQNLMYMTAGFLIERVTGKNWAEFISENLLANDKLQMNNTTFSVVDMQKADDFAYPHVVPGDGARVIPFRNIDHVGPAGSMNSSVADMAKWLQLQLGEGEFLSQRVIDSSVLSEIHSPQMVSNIMGKLGAFEEFGTEHYALGWISQTYRGAKILHHGGGIDGFITFVGILPGQDKAIVVFANAGSVIPYFIGFAYFDLILKGKIGPWEERLDELLKSGDIKFAEKLPLPYDLENYIGVYSHPAYGEVQISKGNIEGTLAFSHYVLNYQLGYSESDGFLPAISDEKLAKIVEPIKFAADDTGAVKRLLWKAEPTSEYLAFEKEATILPFITPSGFQNEVNPKVAFPYFDGVEL